MLILIEVSQIVNDPDGKEIDRLDLACLDLTDNTEAERQEVLANARIIYGTKCSYFWHSCGHDVDPPLPCSKTEA